MGTLLPTACSCPKSPCPDPNFELFSDGPAIVSAASNCTTALTESQLSVAAPARDGGRCQVRATLSSGLEVYLSVDFTPVDTRCCGRLFDIMPPTVTIGGPIDASRPTDEEGG